MRKYALSAPGDAGRLAQRLRDVGVQAEGRAVIGDPAAKIVSTAETIGANLILTSTRCSVRHVGCWAVPRADAVVRSSHRPLLLVRRDARSAHPSALKRAAVTSGA
ncbi:MAG: hypothetical protein M3069_32120 [Chloroflexota bacterium]|nr:hypothetical protein [Chloroflexota bacterium]